MPDKVADCEKFALFGIFLFRPCTRAHGYTMNPHTHAHCRRLDAQPSIIVSQLLLFFRSHVPVLELGDIVASIIVIVLFTRRCTRAYLSTSTKLECARWSSPALVDDADTSATDPPNITSRYTIGYRVCAHMSILLVETPDRLRCIPWLQSKPHLNIA